jgi:hypothetical protein
MMESYTSLNRLRELRGSGYEIVDGQPDVIGWVIKDNYDNRIGVADDLLFDPDQQKVRYIIANLKDNAFDLDKRKVIIPIGNAELHETNDYIILPSISRWQLRALPTYSQRMTEYDERDISTIFSTSSGTTLPVQDSQWKKPANFYDSPAYDHDNLFRKRRKADQKDAPLERTFRQSPAATTHPDREPDTTRSKEPESARYNLVSDNTREQANVENENETVLDRIKRMQQELGEIERDLRSGRETR